MAHEIETAAIFGGAWHNAGKRVDHLMTAPEALAEAGLKDWDLAKAPLYRINAAGEFEIAPSIFAHTRRLDDKVLGYVGDEYQSIHNEVMADIFSLLVDKDGLNVAKMKTAGSLRGGKRIFMTMSLPDSGFTVGNQKHPIIPILLGMNCHDGTGSARFLASTIDVVCNNTLNAALGQAYAEIAVNVRHTGNIGEKIDAVKLMLAEAASMFGDFKVKGDALDDVKVTPEGYEEFMDFLFPQVDTTKFGKRAVENRNKRVMQLTQALKEEVMLLPQYSLTSTATNREFSYWQLLSAVTRFTTHKVGVRVGDREEGEVRFESQLLGAGAEFNAKATAKILDLSGVNAAIAAKVAVAA